MADNMRLKDLVLYDGWPGQPAVGKGIPTDGWDNTTDNFSTADDTAKALNPPVPVGEKRQIYTDNTNCPGYYTMIYLCFHDPSARDISVGDVSINQGFVAHCDTSKSQWSDVSLAPWFVVAQCATGTTTGGDLITGTDVTMGGPIAVACASMTADSSLHSSITDPYSTGFGDGYGWFWCGGVCPVKDATFLADLTYGATCGGRGVDITTDSLMRKGDVVFCYTAEALIPVSTDLSNVADATGTVGKMPKPHAWACASSD